MPVNATHLRVIPGSKMEAGPETGQVMMELESLFREHNDRVFRTAYKVTGSIVDAEDVLQTVFLRLSRRQGELNLEPSPGSYLHRAAINASLDLLRQRGRSKSISIDEVEPVLSAGRKMDPESLRAGREIREVVRRSLGALGEKSAEIFVLKYFEGYDNKEIAGLMGTSPMVVGVLLHRARTRVKKEVGDFLEGGK